MKLQHKRLFTSIFITTSKKHEKISKQRMSNLLYNNIHNFNLLTALWKNYVTVAVNYIPVCSRTLRKFYWYMYLFLKFNMKEKIYLDNFMQ